jgi:hypothetical protein
MKSVVRDSAVSLIAARLGNRTDLNASIILEMQLVQTDRLEGDGTFRPWFLWTDYTTAFETVSGQEYVDLPADFLVEDMELSMRWYDSTISSGNKWRVMRRENLDDTLEYDLGSSDESNPPAEVASPARYAYRGDRIFMSPTPDAVYPLRLFYYRRAAEIDDDNIENEWLKWASDLVIGEVGSVMAGQYIQNPTLEASFMKQAQAARQRLFLMNEERMHAAREYLMGDD